MSTLSQAVPARSLSQRMHALELANEVRSQRADLKRDVKAGRRSLEWLIADPPEFILTMPLYDLMMAAPKLGRVKVNKLLATCRISARKTIGGLTERQRLEIVALLRRRS